MLFSYKFNWQQTIKILNDDNNNYIYTYIYNKVNNHVYVYINIYITINIIE